MTVACGESYGSGGGVSGEHVWRVMVVGGGVRLVTVVACGESDVVGLR